MQPVAFTTVAFQLHIVGYIIEFGQLFTD